MRDKLLAKPDGKTKDLDFGVTTMWPETEFTCYENPDHEITGSTNRRYCYECGVWWWREGYGGKEVKP